MEGPNMVDMLKTGGDEDVGWGIYLLLPFWLFTILLNILSIITEVRGTSKYSNS
jgi:hypothetical protein